MHILQLPVGGLQTNCYILYGDDAAHNGVVVDPGAEPDRILRAIAAENVTVRYILLTHVHFDHILAVKEILQATGAPLLVHRGDQAALTDPQLSLVGAVLPGQRYDLTADRLLTDGDTVTAGALTFTVLHTPGHTPGSVCYVCGDVLVAGDTLFGGSAGRTDLPGGDPNALFRSLRRLAELEGDYTVLPGHGEETTLERERRCNPFMAAFRGE